ncbi:Pls/PosA family non-ribosomal peptide synthetase, partial [Streptomyces specialis]|uniref:Pls/PosA family non-ribosomal peptide synthetase n=1 Tax=Streptomyces specialis TaxID=498367 RepID=UPI000AA6D92E
AFHLSLSHHSSSSPLSRQRQLCVRDRPRTPRSAGWVQTAVQPLLHAVTGLRWVVAIALAGNLLAMWGFAYELPTLSWWVVAPASLALFTLPGRVVLAGAGARLLCAGLRPGAYRRGGGPHLRLWAAERYVKAVNVRPATGTPFAAWYARLLGCRVGRRVHLHALPPVTGLATFGDGCAVEPDADVAGWWLDGDVLRVGAVRIGPASRVGERATLLPGARIGADAEVLPGSCVAGPVPDGECWGGSPAVRRQPETWPVERSPRRGSTLLWALARLLTPALRAMLLWLAVVPVVVLVLTATSDGLASRLLVYTPAVVVLGMACHAALLVVAVRLLGLALRPGTHPVDSLTGWAAWLTHDLADMARRTLFPLYASLFTPVWLRLLGARVGRSVELSTVVALPRMLRVADGAFLADQVVAAPYEMRGGWLRIGRARVGERAFVGNSGLVGPERAVGDGALIGVLSDTPPEVPAGSSRLGNPPMRLRRLPEPGDPARTFAPARSLRAARAGVELCRVVPLLIAGALRVAVTYALLYAWYSGGAWLAVLLCGPVLCAAGVVAAAVATAAKWVLMGRFRPGRHPLWSAFVWRNELYDSFVEVLAVPWLLQPATGSPVLSWWLRSVGARLGRGVWCETHWLPEPDLITVAAGASVNRGCVLQTHLFHDRVMRLEPVRLDTGAVLGPHSIALPGSRIGASSTVGAASLVMAAERVPAGGRWQGNPIRPASR